MRIHRFVITGFAGVVMVASMYAVQLRRPTSATPNDTAVQASLALRVGGQPYEFNGKASCRHAPIASIYGVQAEMWSVQQNDGNRSLALTVWRPKGRTGDWFSLSVSSGGKSYAVNTVQAGRDAETVQGRGTLTFTPSGSGGTFAIEATAAAGGTITGTVTCSAFTAAIAEGGE